MRTIARPPTPATVFLLSLLSLAGAPLAVPAAGTEGDLEPATASRQDGDAEKLIEKARKADPDERETVVYELIEIGPPALEATRRARDAADDPDLRRAFDKAVTWQLAARIIEDLRSGLESQLRFDGQYAHLKDLGGEGVRALLAIINDTATDLALRIHACHAMADVGDESLVPRLRPLAHDILLPLNLREQIGILLAIFGDTHMVERELEDYERLALQEDEESPTRSIVGPTFEMRRLIAKLGPLQKLSNLHYRIRNYKKAVDYYEEILDVYRQVIALQEEHGASDRRLAAARKVMSLHYYNAACSNALLGDIEKAKEYLREAVEGDPMHLENIERDGDLRRLREHPSYDEFQEELGRLFEGEDL